jgi:parallel beta-helix repeat protein
MQFSAILLGAFGLAVTPFVAGAPSEPANSPHQVRCNGVSVPQNVELETIVRREPSATTFCIGPGVHRLTSPVTLKPGDRLIGDRGAILNGSRRLTNWTRTGSVWVSSGQTQRHTSDGVCDKAHPLCNNEDDVFLDGKPLTPVGSVGAVRPRTFFFDYANDRISIGANPAGHKVEASTTGGVGGCSTRCGPRTLISGLVIEKFSGAGVEISDGTVANNEVRWNHADGIGVARDGIIRNNDVHDNGLAGVESAGADPRRNLVVVGNDLSHNGWFAGYDKGWESGGGKWLRVNRLTIRNNDVHDNRGAGLWLDTDNIHVDITWNRIVDNTDNGIEYEASYDGTIAHNTIRGNGFASSGAWVEGAGILNVSSPNVSVYRNRLADNFDGIGAEDRTRGTGRYGKRDVRDFDVHNNTIKNSRRNGLISVSGDTSFFTTKHNRWAHNRYTCVTGPFEWMNSGGDFGWWRSFGNDTTGGLTGCR